MLLEYPCAMQRKNHYWRREGDLYNYAITVAIAFFIFTNIVSAAPTFENSLPTHSNEIVEYFSEINGCYYNFQRYEEGDRIVTNEPCLNCTCHNRMLMCYLRVCPFTKAIGQDCTIEKKPDQCCPIITCPEVPVKLLTSSTTSSPAPITSTTEIGFRDNYGCIINNLFYADGAQVPSDVNKPCELCYCIRNRTACVMQECTLHVEGCKPIFKPGVCCPVRYECDYDREYTSTVRLQTIGGLSKSTTSSPVVDCQYGNKYFSDGELIKTEKPCEHCYCMRGDIVCAVQDCGEPLRGKDCIATTPPPNKCCPSSYACANETAMIEDITKASDITGTTFVQSDNTFAAYDTTTYRFKNTPTVLTQEEVYERLGEKKTSTTTLFPEKTFTTISNLFSKHPSEDIQLHDESVDASEHSSPLPAVSLNEPPKEDSIVTEKPDLDEEKTTPGVADVVTSGASLPKASQGVIISSTQYEPTTVTPTKDVEDNATKEGFTKSPIDETHDTAVSATEITTEKIKYETTKFSEKYDATKLPEKETLSEKLTTPRSSATVVSNDGDDMTEKLVTTEVVIAEKVVDEITTTNFLHSKLPLTSEKPVDESSSESIKFQSTTRQFDKNGVLSKDQETTKAPEESLQATTKIQTDNTEPPLTSHLQTDNLNTLSPESTASLLENITKIISSVQNNNKIPTYQIPTVESTKTPVVIDATTIAEEEFAAGTEKVAEISLSTAKDEVATVVPSVIPGEGSCLVDGITYPNTSIIESYNPCHSKCICLSSIPTCTLITCAPPPSNPNCMPIQMKPESCCPVYICNSDKQPAAQVPSSHSQIMPDEPEDANHLPHDDETTIVNSYEISTKASDSPKPTSETITEKIKPETADVNENKPPSEVAENASQNDAFEHKPQNDIVEDKPQDDGIEHLPLSDDTDTESEHDGFEPKPTAESDLSESKPVDNESIEHKPTSEKDQVEDKPELTALVNDKIQNEQTTEGQKVVEGVTELSIRGSSVASDTAKPEIVTTEKQSSIDKIDNPVTESIAVDEPTTVKASPIKEEYNTENDNLTKPTTVKTTEEKIGGPSETPTTLPPVTSEHTEKPAQHDDKPVDHDNFPLIDENGALEDDPLLPTVGSQNIITENPPVTNPASTSEKYSDTVSHSVSEFPHHDLEMTEVEKTTTTEGNVVVQPNAVSTESKDQAQNYVTEIISTETGVTDQVDEKIDVNPTTLPEKIAEINPTTLTSEKIEPVPTTLPPKVSDEQNDVGLENNTPSSTQGTLEYTQTSEEIDTTDEVPVVTDSPTTTTGVYSSSSTIDNIGTEVPNEFTTKLYESYSSTQPGVLTEDIKHQEPESIVTTIKDILINDGNPSVETTTAAQIINEKITTFGESTNIPDVTSSNPANEFTSELYSSSVPTVEKETESDVVTDITSHSSEQLAPDTHNLQTTTVDSETPVAETTESAIIGVDHQQTSSPPSYGSDTTSNYVDPEKHSETTSHYVDPEKHFETTSHYVDPEKHFETTSLDIDPEKHSETTSHYVDPEKHSETTSHYVDPEKHSETTSHYVDPEKHSETTSHYVDPEKHFETTSHYADPEKHFETTAHYVDPEKHSETTSHYVDLEKHSETTSHYVDPEKHTGSGLVVTYGPPLSDITTIHPTYDEGIKGHEENVKPITILPETYDSPAVTVLPSKTTFPSLLSNFATEVIPTESPIGEHPLSTSSGHGIHESIQQGGDETTSSHDSHEPVQHSGEDETSQKIGSSVTEHPTEPVVPETASQEPTTSLATKKHAVSEPNHTPQYVVETSSVSQTPIQHSTWTRKPFDEETSEPNYYPPAPMYPTGGGDGGIESPSEESEYEEGSNFGTGTCRYAGKIYVSAQQIPREDPCDFCFCFRSDIICLQQSCPPPIQGCRQETISGFCCPRYECPVASALTYNASTTTTTTTTSTTTTAQPHFTLDSYRSHARKVGCMIHGYFYKVGEDIAIASGPCLECICGSDGRMKCDPKSCSPEPFVRSFIGEALSKR